MPAWSTEVANEFIALARQDGRALDQLQLQKLVYIAHGWCLAATGQPLTGDRPEAWEHGPIYRRLAEALADRGLDPVDHIAGPVAVSDKASVLEPIEVAFITRTFKEYGSFPAPQLSSLTRRGNAPWKTVYDCGAGRFRDISHILVRDQFVELASSSSSSATYVAQQYRH